MTKKVKTCMISTAAENTSALWTVSGDPFQRVGAVLRNDLAPECFLFVFSPNPEMLIVFTG